jgi:hypothetical protein
MSPSGRYIVVTGARGRNPEVPLRIVGADGETVYVIDAEAANGSHADHPRGSFEDAVLEAFARVGRPLPVVAGD